MPKVRYIKKKFQSASIDLIEKSNTIITEYQAQGFNLTLRQLYYQLVSRNILANTEASYQKLGTLINDARLAGLVDWSAIEDRTRRVQKNSHWASVADILDVCETTFALDLWADQPYAPEVWIEKDALLGVIDGVCTELDVPYFSCRGYTSQSSEWRASVRVIEAAEQGRKPIIFYLGDHDPSGLDMTRDHAKRMSTFGAYVEIKRIALNLDQVGLYSLPANPTKLTDSRASAYTQEYGFSSWELDALQPDVIVSLITQAVTELIDSSAQQVTLERERTMRNLIASYRDDAMQRNI
jgi:hypothetical protein